VGGLVQWCIREKVRTEDLTLESLRKFSSRFDGSALDLLSPEASVRTKKALGATAPTRVRAALRAARKRNG
jgi:argininosuccinate lyase